MSDVNKRIANKSLTLPDATAALVAWDQVNSVLGIEARKDVIVFITGVAANAQVGQITVSTADGSEQPIVDEIRSLMEQRQVARKEKNFKRSDEIRDELKAKGWVVEDSPKGSKLKKI